MCKPCAMCRSMYVEVRGQDSLIIFLISGNSVKHRRQWCRLLRNLASPLRHFEMRYISLPVPWNETPPEQKYDVLLVTSKASSDWTFLILRFHNRNSHIRDMRDASEVKSTGCPCKGPEFSVQHPHDSSQRPVTVVTRDPMPSSDFLGHKAVTWCI